MQDRNSGIDVLRGLAILLVLEQHLLWWPFFKLVLDAPPLVIGILQYGWAGVDLFFVVSAYLLTANLLRHRGETHLVALFYARRALRILPLYWLLLLVGFATRHWWLSSGGNESFWLWRNPQPLHHYLLFMQNWAGSGRPGPGPEFFGPTWSLAAEEHFYFLLPLLLAWLKPRQLGWFAASLILVSPFLRVAITDGAGPLAGAFWTIAHLDAFAWGVLIALVSQFRPHLLTLASARFYGGWGAAIITSAIFLAPGARGTPLGVTLVALGGGPGPAGGGAAFGAEITGPGPADARARLVREALLLALSLPFPDHGPDLCRSRRAQPAGGDPRQRDSGGPLPRACLRLRGPVLSGGGKAPHGHGQPPHPLCAEEATGPAGGLIRAGRNLRRRTPPGRAPAPERPENRGRRAPHRGRGRQRIGWSTGPLRATRRRSRPHPPPQSPWIG